MNRAIFPGLVFLAIALSGLGQAWAAPTPEQTAKATSAEEALKQAGKLIIGKKYQEALPLVEQAQAAIAELDAGNADGKKLAAGLEGRLNAARRVLESNGIKVPEPAKPSTPTTAGGVSFTKEIAPIFVARCNNCHVRGTRGGFNLASYSALMRGADSGRVVFPGKSDGSRLIEVLDSGDMPRGGGKLPDAEISLIAKWIDQGAKFDGTDPNASISAGTPTPGATPPLQVSKATGKESVLFSRDIALVLEEKCTGCHGGAQPRARLALTTFRGLLAGSDNGPIVTPGKGADSVLVRKLKGQAGARMPLNQPPLPDDVIAKFEKWINEGAKFDGTDPAMNVGMVGRVYLAGVMSYEELSAERKTLAEKNWQLANPDDRPEKAESERFLVLGNVSEEELQEVRRTAEQQAPKVARLLKAPGGAPLVKGRITLFVFRKRYDYAELGRMVERRELPGSSQGHFFYNVVDAYAGLVMPQSEDASLAGLVSEQLAGIYLESLSNGSMPSWFSQGTAWAVAASLDAKDPRVQAWDASVVDALRSSSKPEDFLSNALPPEPNMAANYSFCKFLMSNSRGFSALLSELKEKKDFNEAFLKAYGAEAKSLAPVWFAAAARKR